MELFETIHCPFCGAANELGLDSTIPEQSFTTDCEVCCRPLLVKAECEPGEVISLEVREG